MDLETIWPPFALTVRTQDMDLTAVRESDYCELADLARGGVRNDGIQAFLVDWDSGSPEEIARSIAQYQWGTRANFRTDEWTIEFTVRVSGRIVGVQGVNSTSFLKTRAISTGSWLAREEQGKGYGTRMRSMIVTAFAEHFSTTTFETAYVEDNHASRRVSEKVGYSPNGSRVTVTQDGEAHTEHRMILRADDIRVPDAPVNVDGVNAFRQFLGLDPS